jgi:hypothetical protein
MVRSVWSAPYDCGLCGTGFSGSMAQDAAVESDPADSREPGLFRTLSGLDIAARSARNGCSPRGAMSDASDRVNRQTTDHGHAKK